MFIGFGDLAQHGQLQRVMANAKAQTASLSVEVVTGIAEDVSKHLSGNLGPLASIEATLSSLSTYRTVAKDAALTTSIMQTNLESVELRLSDALPSISNAVSLPSFDNWGAAARASEEAIKSIFQSLNTMGPNGSLFSGAATDTPPLASVEEFFAQLETVFSQSNNKSEVISNLDFFFEDVSGFDTLIYNGSQNAKNDLSISRTRSIDIDVKANDGFIKNTLKGLSLMIAAGSDSYAWVGREDLANQGYEDILSSQSDLTSARAQIGYAQEATDISLTENQAQKTSFELARNALLAVDPFEAATALEQKQTELETIYAITARLSRLNLTDFL